MNEMNRRRFMKNLAWGGAVFFLGEGLTTEILANDAQVRDYLNYDMLRANLYAKTKLEDSFLKDVLTKVDEKVVPIKIVYASYKYAMKKKKSERIFYFSHALTILCKKAGIKVTFQMIS